MGVRPKENCHERKTLADISFKDSFCRCKSLYVTGSALSLDIMPILGQSKHHMRQYIFYLSKKSAGFSQLPLQE